jgi:hypothetical protein
MTGATRLGSMVQGEAGSVCFVSRRGRIVESFLYVSIQTSSPPEISLLQYSKSRCSGKPGCDGSRQQSPGLTSAKLVADSAINSSKLTKLSSLSISFLDIPELTQREKVQGKGTEPSGLSGKSFKYRFERVMGITPLPGQVRAQPYNWPHDASFTHQNTALVIIDMQRDCKGSPSSIDFTSTESVTSL